MTSIEQLLAGMDAAAMRLDDSLYGLGDDLMDSAPDDGWTIKDILGHIAAWNEYMCAVLDGEGGIEAFGISPDVATMAGEDPINEAMVARWSALSIDEVWDRFVRSRAGIRDRIAVMDPSLLSTPMRAVAPDSPVADDAPLGDWLQGAVVDHGDDHLPRIMSVSAALAADATIAGEIARLDTVFAGLEAAVGDRLSRDDGRCDDGGWSVADNFAHLAAWNRELIALIRREPVADAVGVAPDVWLRGDEAEINAAIREAHAGLTAEAAWADLRETVGILRAALAGLDDADLHRPRADFDRDAGRMGNLPLLRWVRSCAELHPLGHQPGIVALLGE